MGLRGWGCLHGWGCWGSLTLGSYGCEILDGVQLSAVVGSVDAGKCRVDGA